MKKVILAAVAASILGGCASGVPGLRPRTYQQPGEARVFVSYDDCPHTTSRQGFGLLATLASAAVPQLLDNFGTALTNAAQGGDLPASTATANIEVPDEAPRCLIIVRGRFSDGEGGPRVALPAPQDEEPTLTVISRDGAKVKTKLPPVSELHHYIELQMMSSANKSALSFAPVVTHIERSMDGGKRGSRALSIAVKFQRAGKEQSTGGAVLIGDRQIGETDRYAPDRTTHWHPYESPWFAGFDLSPVKASESTGTGGGGGAGGPGGAAGRGTSAGAPAVTAGGVSRRGRKAPLLSYNLESFKPQSTFPYTITATVVETRPTKEFLALIASVFTSTGVKTALGNEIRGSFDPAMRRTEENTSLEAEGSYAEALGKAHSGLFQYCAIAGTADKVGERYLKSGETRKLQLAANKAALAADVPLPFEGNELVMVSGAAVGEANAGPCGG